MNSTPRSFRFSSIYQIFFFASIFMAFSIGAVAQNTISAVAGGGSVNGPATGPNADIPGASGVTIDSKGNTYVAVPAANQIFKIDTTSNLTVYAGLGWPTEYPQHLDGLKATQASLNNPTGVAADNVGNLYIADTTDYLIRKVGPNGDIHTVAGSGHQCQVSTDSCGDNTPAKGTQVLMSSPLGVATDAAGNIYIADTKDNRIRVVNPQAQSITIAGVTIAPGNIATVAGTGDKCTTPTLPCGDGGSAVAAFLNNPQGVAVDAAGNIYVADSGDHRIRIVSTTGTINAYVGTGNPCVPKAGCGDGGPALSASLSGPWQMSVDTAGDLFLTDAPENKIREVNASTLIITTVAGNGMQGFSGDGGSPLSAQLNAPHGVWVDSSGNFVIGDTGNQRVRLVTSQITSTCPVPPCITTLAGGGLADSPTATSAIVAANRGVALDTTGNLYIADTANNRVRELNSAGVTTFAGSGIVGSGGNNGPATAAMFNAPDGVATDASGNVYVADTANLVIREVNASTNIIQVVAGTTGKVCTPTTAPCGDGGPATSAMFTMPSTVSLDSVGNIYITDQGANRIRRVDVTTGIITTVVGTGVACTNSAIGMCGDGGPATSAQLNGPFSAVVDGSGNIYIADTNDNRIREVQASTGNIVPYAFNGMPLLFGPMNVPALTAMYDTPQNLALDPRGNLYVSGSAIFYVIVRIDANATGNPVTAVAGIPGDPKFYGYAGDGGPALGAALNNTGVAIDGSGHLYVSDAGNDHIREILLTPSATVSPASLTFPAQLVGTTSSPMTFKLINKGSDDLIISTIVASGDFQLTQANPCMNNQVAPGQSCTVPVTFRPTMLGIRTGSVTITDNAYQNPTQTVPLTGTGVSLVPVP
jgi:trimeric autotransporter adhesin